MASLATERFFANTWVGVIRKGGTTEVVARLRQITVDPKTVVLAQKADSNTYDGPNGSVIFSDAPPVAPALEAPLFLLPCKPKQENDRALKPSMQCAKVDINYS